MMAFMVFVCCALKTSEMSRAFWVGLPISVRTTLMYGIKAIFPIFSKKTGHGCTAFYPTTFYPTCINPNPNPDTNPNPNSKKILT